MKIKLLSYVLFLVIITGNTFFPLYGISQTETLTIKTISFHQVEEKSAHLLCDSSWVEDEIVLFVTAISKDFPCDFAFSEGEVALYPAKLVVQLDSILSNNLRWITFDIEDHCGEACSIVTLFDESDQAFETLYNSQIGDPETLRYQKKGTTNIVKVTFESMEGVLRQIRFY